MWATMQAVAEEKYKGYRCVVHTQEPVSLSLLQSQLESLTHSCHDPCLCDQSNCGLQVSHEQLTVNELYLSFMNGFLFLFYRYYSGLRCVCCTVARCCVARAQCTVCASLRSRMTRTSLRWIWSPRPAPT